MSTHDSRAHSSATPDTTTEAGPAATTSGAIAAPATTSGAASAATSGKAATSGASATLAPGATATSFATVRGIRIRHVTVGEGQPLLLLHGWGTSLDTFTAMAGDMSRQFRVTAFDFPGHGGSEMPPATWTVDDFVALTVELIQTLGLERPSILGHSFGGRVAIKLAAAHPEALDRLVLVDAAGVPPARTLKRRLKSSASRTANAIGRSLGRPGQQIRRWIVTRIASPDYLNAGPLRSTFLAVVREDLRPVMPRIKAPTLLVWGDSDEDTPVADARVMEKLIRGARLQVLKNAGHFSYLDQYGRFRLAVIPFLDD